MNVVEVPRISATPEEFAENFACKDEPVVLTNLSWGPCKDIWSPEYLCSKLGSRPVKIHRSKHSNLSFVQKNFSYETLGFDNFVKLCAGQNQVKEYFYLRALGNDARGRDVADFRMHFPAISEDFVVPEGIYPEGRLFSSVLRVSSGDVQLWTHYDVMDNILVQVVGEKRVYLFPPTDAEFIYPVGDKSLVEDLDLPDFDKFPKLASATCYKCFLKPGDALFIPSLWYHNVKALDFSVAVNFFWCGMRKELYDAGDPYGNKDPVPVARAAQSVDKAVALLRTLPPKFAQFYGRKLANVLYQKSSEG